MPSEEPLPQEEHGYYNLKDSSRGIPSIKSPENSSSHRPDVGEESDEDDREYYNSRFKSHEESDEDDRESISNLKSHAESDADDREYYNTSLKSHEENDADDREYYNTSLKSREENDADDREYYNTSLKCWLPTGKNPEVNRANR